MYYILYYNKTNKLQNTNKIKMFDVLNIYFVSNKGFGKIINIRNRYTNVVLALINVWPRILQKL